MDGHGSLRIVDLPESERPRERLERLGPASLSDQELLAILLRTGGQGLHAVDLAGSLLNQQGSVQALASADFVDLTRYEQVGPAKASTVIAAFELGRRAAGARAPAIVIRGPEDIAEAVRPLLDGRAVEEVVLLVTGSGNRLKRIVPLTRGGPDRCLLIARDVIATVLRHGGTGFAVAHNHPSGDCSPSAEDRAATLRIEAAARAVGLVFLDHLVVAGSEWRSARAG